MILNVLIVFVCLSFSSKKNNQFINHILFQGPQKSERKIKLSWADSVLKRAEFYVHVGQTII